MEKEKNIKEFLQVLIDLTQANLDFLNGIKINHKLKSKYIDEIKQIQDVINNFKFVKNVVHEEILLDHPIPKQIIDYFGK